MLAALHGVCTSLSTLISAHHLTTKSSGPLNLPLLWHFTFDFLLFMLILSVDMKEVQTLGVCAHIGLLVG